MRAVQKISRKGLYPKHIGYFLTGFVEGEGSFNVSLRKKSDFKLGWQIVLSFNVSQKDPTILKIIQNCLNCGIIKVRKKDNLHSYDCTNAEDIIDKVIPFFNKYPLLSDQKKNNYKIFCEIAQIIKEKKHLSKDGFLKILVLREKLNPGIGRKRKYSIIDVLGKESSETTRQALN